MALICEVSAQVAICSQCQYFVDDSGRLFRTGWIDDPLFVTWIGGGLSCNPLDLSSKGIQTLAPDVLQYIFAQSIDLSNNSITDIPVNAFQNAKVSTILLKNNKISTIPSGIKLNELETLDLSNNRITSLPADFLKGFPKLRVLILSNNRISSLPSSFFEGSFKQMTIDLSNNLMVSLPVNFLKGSVGLMELNLSNNLIDSMSIGWCKNSTLNRLSLSQNNISILAGNTFNGCFDLSVLALDNNKIVSNLLRVSTYSASRFLNPGFKLL